MFSPTQLGKHVASRWYVHTSLVNALDGGARALLSQAWSLASHVASDYNVVRIDDVGPAVAFLNYPAFYQEGCPALLHSWKVDLASSRVTSRSYEESINPPILHRKELLIAEGDPNRSAFEDLTAALESIDCFSDPVRIGFKLPWEQLLRERGYRIVGHQLIPIGNDESPPDDDEGLVSVFRIARHLTALTRQSHSAPIQVLQRFGMLDGSRAVFDYGCGKGDDVRGLQANGIRAFGWDPHFAPNGPISSAEIVNLGFVLNVIEDPLERREALRRAYSYATEVLVVSTLVATDNPQGTTLYGDGVLTSRTTFQKYFRQAELREYLDSSLGEESISVAPGIFFVFKDKHAAQRFQAMRFRGRIRARPLQRAPRSERPASKKPALRAGAFESHRPLLEPIFLLWRELGREPDVTEVTNLAEIEGAIGSFRKALALIRSHYAAAPFEQYRAQRLNDLLVFLALEQFQQRKPFGTLEPRLQRDIRAFFGNYQCAKAQAKALLFQVSDPVVIDECCQRATDSGLGWLEPGHSLQVHTSLVERLPAPLRAYVGCAGVLFGDVRQADIVKIHIQSGKVTFMNYDDFFGKAIPKMILRTKVNLRSLDVKVFSYGEGYPSPALYLKSRFMHEEQPTYPEQTAFDDAVQGLPIDLSGFGPSADDFDGLLSRLRYRVDGLKLERSTTPPDLDSLCGRYLSYRQLIECGETQFSTQLSNVPLNPASFAALLDLATNVLDPVIEYFGQIDLTYGFCSRELATHIKRRVAPRLDQHASHERRAGGSYVCNRLGAAVDFVVKDENMEDVAKWVATNTPFDRLYYYGPTRPIHVSYGPSHAREGYLFVQGKDGRALPRRWSIATYPRCRG